MFRSLQQRERDISQRRYSQAAETSKFTAEGERHFPTHTGCGVNVFEVYSRGRETFPNGSGADRVRHRSLQQRERDISQLEERLSNTSVKFTAEGERHFPTDFKGVVEYDEVYSRGRETFPNLPPVSRSPARSLQQRERDISQRIQMDWASVRKFTAEGERHFPTQHRYERGATEVYSRGRETFPNSTVANCPMRGSLQQRERDISQLARQSRANKGKFTAEGETFPNDDLQRTVWRGSLQQRERDISQPLPAMLAPTPKFTAEGERHFPT